MNINYFGIILTLLAFLLGAVLPVWIRFEYAVVVAIIFLVMAIVCAFFTRHTIPGKIAITSHILLLVMMVSCAIMWGTWRENPQGYHPTANTSPPSSAAQLDQFMMLENDSREGEEKGTEKKKGEEEKGEEGEEKGTVPVN